MFCGSCGDPLHDGARFCGRCGAGAARTVDGLAGLTVASDALPGAGAVPVVAVLSPMPASPPTAGAPAAPPILARRVAVPPALLAALVLAAFVIAASALWIRRGQDHDDARIHGLRGEIAALQVTLRRDPAHADAELLDAARRLTAEGDSAEFAKDSAGAVRALSAAKAKFEEAVAAQAAAVRDAQARLAALEAAAPARRAKSVLDEIRRDRLARLDAAARLRIPEGETPPVPAGRIGVERAERDAVAARESAAWEAVLARWSACEREIPFAAALEAGEADLAGGRIDAAAAALGAAGPDGWKLAAGLLREAGRELSTRAGIAVPAALVDPPPGETAVAAARRSLDGLAAAASSVFLTAEVAKRCTPCDATGECRGCGAKGQVAFACGRCRGAAKVAQPCATCNASKAVVCANCGGRGVRDAGCAKCSATGAVACPMCRGEGQRACGACAGEGYKKCRVCGGKKCPLCEFDGKTDCASCGTTGKSACADCESSGRVQCPECRGTRAGTVECARCRRSGRTPCAACGARGTADGPCPDCAGGTRTAPCVGCSGSGLCATCAGRGRVK